MRGGSAGVSWLLCVPELDTAVPWIAGFGICEIAPRRPSGGIPGALEYYRQGFVVVPMAAWLAAGLFAGSLVAIHIGVKMIFMR